MKARVARHPLGSQEFLCSIDFAVGSLLEQVNSANQDKQPYDVSDAYRERLDVIFADRVGKAFPQDKLNDIRKIGEERYKKKIPPGFSDDKKNDPEKYGDLVIWEEIIVYAKQEQRSCIFITDDKKEDWWFRLGGRTYGPHPELIDEFQKKTGKSFYAYTHSQFIDHAGKYLNRPITDAAKKEIQNITEDYYLDVTASKEFTKSIRALDDAQFEHIMSSINNFTSKDIQSALRIENFCRLDLPRLGHIIARLDDESPGSICLLEFLPESRAEPLG
jgi:hypothetical protein